MRGGHLLLGGIGRGILGVLRRLPRRRLGGGRRALNRRRRLRRRCTTLHTRTHITAAAHAGCCSMLGSCGSPVTSGCICVNPGLLAELRLCRLDKLPTHCIYGSNSLCCGRETAAGKPSEVSRSGSARRACCGGGGKGGPGAAAARGTCSGGALRLGGGRPGLRNQVAPGPADTAGHGPRPGLLPCAPWGWTPGAYSGKPPRRFRSFSLIYHTLPFPPVV